MPEPTQTPTPEKTPGQKGNPKRPQANRVDSEASTTTEVEGDEPEYDSRSRSQSRRRRRQNQRQRTMTQGKAKAGQGGAEAESMASIDEDAEQEQKQDGPIPPPSEPKHKWLKNPAPQDVTEAQPFEYIKPPSQSMDGPVTFAKMTRGEIPWRGAPPRQPIETTQGTDAKTDGPNPMDQDGLKLRIELNLDIEIELKAHIHGDLTLALL